MTKLLWSIVFLLPAAVFADCPCEPKAEDEDRSLALKYKGAAIASILVAGALGVCLPVAGRRFPALSPENDFFFIVKAFAAGVILSTGFIHVLPEAFEKLTDPCIPKHPWGDFPFTGFVAMVAAIGTLMVDTVATSYYARREGVNEVGRDEDGEVPLHTHATHGHAHGSIALASDETELLRHRVISQAKFNLRTVVLMALFFSITTPGGIAIGIGIRHIYSETSPTALIIEGIFNSASAGILIYMALVDLLSADFMSPKMQSSGKLQLGANASLLAGAGCMSLLAKWA